MQWSAVISPPAGLKPETPWSEVGNAVASTVGLEFNRKVCLANSWQTLEQTFLKDVEKTTLSLIKTVGYLNYFLQDLSNKKRNKQENVWFSQHKGEKRNVDFDLNFVLNFIQSSSEKRQQPVTVCAAQESQQVNELVNESEESPSCSVYF